ncbi:ATP-binding protein [Nocardia asteroides]|uniref:ATP-binding protein n=1 Tax=Nocardia asteroides TaxID=1824 RepID=UPI0034155D4B
MEPSKGEVSAIVGFGGQFDLAARIVIAKISTLEWIRVADPEAGVADDFQFKAGARRYGLQVKWSQIPGSFTWSDLTKGEKAKAGRPGKPGLLTRLAEAWKRMRSNSIDPLSIYLCSNHLASNNPSTGPFADSTADAPHSLAHFIALSFEPVRTACAEHRIGWLEIEKLQEYLEWKSVWDTMRELVALDDIEFVEFLTSLELAFGISAATSLLVADQNHTDGDVAHVAHALQNMVRDPSRPVHFSRAQLLERLGWSDKLRYRHRHLFPIPTIFAANATACTALEKQLHDLRGGYLALIGPAGSGKSTLLASLKAPGHLVRYYAFVPDAPDPLSSRGEAESWMHDLSLALEDSGLPRQGIGNDLRSQQQILLKQLERAGDRWAAFQERTVIVIDGLDHIPREQKPTRSLIEELPSPSAIPDGVFLVLGTQTTAILPPTISEIIDSPERTVVLPPLSTDESRRLIELAGLDSWMYADQIERAVDAGEGHPLAVTYLLQELVQIADDIDDVEARRLAADRTLSEASGYGRDVEARYRGYYLAVADDQRSLELLGVVARLRVPVSLSWLKSWADPHAFTNFAKRASTFFRRSDTEWRFIHNSFRRFLENETACVAGTHDQELDRRFHEQLAEICAKTGNDWRIYREEEIAHRYLAGQHSTVLRLATPDNLRCSLRNLRPVETVRSHAVLALRSAAVVDEASAFVPLLAFLNDLWNLEYTFEGVALIEALIEIDLQLALEHILRGGRLRVDVEEAVRLALDIGLRGMEAGVLAVLRACGGLAGVIDGRGLHTDQAVANYAKALWRISGTDAVLDELDHHIPPVSVVPSTTSNIAESSAAVPQSAAAVRQQEHDLDEEDTDSGDRQHYRNIVYAMCFDGVAELRDDEKLDALTGVIDREGSPDWRARARLSRARVASEDKVSTQVLELVREILVIDAELGLDEDDEEDTTEEAHHSVQFAIRVAAAELLVRNGYVDGAEVSQLLPSGSSPRWPSSTAGRGRDGLAPFKSMMTFNRVRQLRPDPTTRNRCGSTGAVFDDAGTERLRRALGRLAEMEGQQLKADLGLSDPPAVSALSDPVVRLFEVPRHRARHSTGLSVPTEIGQDLYKRLVELAVESGGLEELKRLWGVFNAAWTHPQRSTYWPPERQLQVITAVSSTKPETWPWVTPWLERLEAGFDEQSHEPYGQSTGYLAQARAWATIHRPDKAYRCAGRAVIAATGIAVHDNDEQLADWVSWLAAAAHAGELTAAEFGAAVRKHALRIVAIAPNARPHAQRAAEQLIGLTFSRNAELGCAIAEWLCDSEAADEVRTVQAVVLAACTHPDMPVSDGADLAANLLYPVSSEVTPLIGQVIVDRCGNGEPPIATIELAERTWTLGDPRTWSQAAEAHGEHDRDEPQTAPVRDSNIETVGALLGRLRKAVSIDDSPVGGWGDAVSRVASTGRVSSIVVEEVLRQALRLGLDGAALGTLVALAARSGALDSATQALAHQLGKTHGAQWRRQAAGESRLNLLENALGDRHPVLVQLARRDLANSLASGALAGHLTPDDISRIVAITAGPRAIETAWPLIDDYLAQAVTMPPASENEALPASIEDHDPVTAVGRWAAKYLGHPVRPLDFGARRFLQLLRVNHAHAVNRILARLIFEGGWQGEAALLTLITTPVAEADLNPSDELIEAIRSAAVGSDGICRDLAIRFASLCSVDIERPSPRPLPLSYEFRLPPLPPRIVPEADAEGVPLLDLSDPQQLLSPFDTALERLADQASLAPATVLHYASRLANSSQDRWIHNGHHGMAALLKARQQFHVYRPWAYMAGRRAIGRVLADLADAGRIARTPRSLWSYIIGLIDERLASLPTQPISPGIPMPWQIGDSQYYSDDWCSETQNALNSYIYPYSQHTPFVLAESSEWKVLDWSKPTETRAVHARLGAQDSSLLLPEIADWNARYSHASGYPEVISSNWDNEELAVKRYESWSDGAYMWWIALQPAVAYSLGWRPDCHELFTWNGADGSWRARTVVMARGQLSHRTSQGGVCGQVWQVQLSQAGRSEMTAAFSGLRRQLTVIRTTHEDHRAGHSREEPCIARADLLS